MSEIKRIETNARMSRVVISEGLVYLSGLTADDVSKDIRGQTVEVLVKVEKRLAEAGTDKTRLISAQIWLKDIERDFGGMNEVWESWVPAGAAPVRATCEAKLARSELLVEIIIIGHL